jgi:hypothetical protein
MMSIVIATRAAAKVKDNEQENGHNGNGAKNNGSE